MKLKYFAWVRERIGKAEETVELPAGIHTVEQLISGFDPAYRAIVELSLRGDSAAEIAARLGYSGRTVQRVRERLERRLRRMHEGGVDEP